MILRLLCLLIGYVFGLFQTAFIYGKIHGIDIREHGSGNSGTTNALRTLGTKAGIIVFLGDALKCLFAVLIVKSAFGTAYPDLVTVLGAYTGLGCVLGHMYPFYMKFKGGKGVACTAGLIASFSLPLTIIEIIAFAAIAYFTQYVSLGSICVCVLFFVGTIILGVTGLVSGAAGHIPELVLVTFLICALIIWKHQSNIQRLLSGTERKSHLFHNKGEN